MDIKVARLIDKKEYKAAEQFIDSICLTGKTEQNKMLIYFCYYLSGRTTHNNVEKQLEYYYLALKYAENNALENSKYLVYANTGIAVVYSVINDFENAIFYLKKAKKISEKNSNYKMPFILNFLALSALDLNDTISAIAYQKELITKFKNDISKPDLYLFVFDYFLLTNQLDSAIIYGNKYISSEPNTSGVIADIYYKTGAIYLQNKDSVNAIKLIEKAFVSVKKSALSPLKYKISKILMDLAISRKEYEKAEYYYTISNALEDSIPNLKTVGNISKMEYVKPGKKDSGKQNNLSFLTTILGVLLIVFLTSIVVYFSFGGLKHRLTTLKNRNNEHDSLQMNEKEYLDIETKIQLFFSNQLFLKKECNATFLVTSLGLKNERYLRAYVKEKYKKNIKDLINELRLDYIVNLLVQNKRIRSYTIDEIASKAGFHSRTTFFRNFKKHTGLSPIDFINQI